LTTGRPKAPVREGDVRRGDKMIRDDRHTTGTADILESSQLVVGS
jgi:hypothetical protein